MMRASTRLARLMPGGVPRYVRAYDNGGESADRFTVIFSGRYRHATNGAGVGLALSADPFHPLGVGQSFEWEGPAPDVAPGAWGGPPIGRRCHLGRRIEWADLPTDCQRAALNVYRDLWGLAPREA
jgi:hypothetical protein